jgi:hypothetical protein
MGTCSVLIGSLKWKVCGQGNVINLFRDENKLAKIFFEKLAERKGNFARDRSRAAREKFHRDRAISETCSGSHF